MLRRWWNYISNNALLAALGASALTALGTAVWLGVKDPAGKWLASDAHITHWGLLLLLLLLITAAAFIGALVFTLSRERTRAQPVLTPPMARQAPPVEPLPLDTLLTDVEVAALTVLMRSYPREVELVDLWDHMCDLNSVFKPRIDGRGIAARAMERLAGAGMVHFRPVGRETRYYQLADAGRDWLTERTERARHRAEGKHFSPGGGGGRRRPP